MKRPGLKAIVALAAAFTLTGARADVFLLNADFGGDTPSGNTGPAAIGQAGDFWNVYLRNDGFGNWRTAGIVNPMLLADGTMTSVSMTVLNCPGAWGAGAPNPMYNDYIYPFGGDGTISFTGLPGGLYDVYAYSADGNFELNVDDTSYGVRTSRDNAAGTNPVPWTEGRQYARYGNVLVGAGQDLVLTIRPGQDFYAIISGMQIVAVPEPASCALVGAGLLGVGLIRRRRSGRVG